MGLLARKQHPMRRKSDIEAWERTIDGIAHSMCPFEELEAYRERQAELRSSALGNVKCFPVWRKYRAKALKVAHLQRSVPLFKKLPMAISRIVSELIYQ